MKTIGLFLIMALCFQYAVAQERQLNSDGEGASLFSVLKEGEISGHIRNYFMNTINRNGKDYYANAIGGLLNYETKSYKGFQVGVSGIFTYRAFSADLNDPDASTDKPSKWERELFDVNHPGNYNGLDRLEELFIRYRWKSSYITYGKIPVAHTPLLNKSDGRMKPFAFQGGWLRHVAREGKWTVDAAWLHRFSPRSMTEWYPLEETIGLTDNGFQPDGTKAEYAEHISSKGVAIAHLGKKSERWVVDMWNIHLDRMINTSWAQVEYSARQWTFGAIWSYQVPLKFQKRLPYENRYVQPDENGQVLSLVGKRRYMDTSFKLAYTRAFDTGRYLFPRELGRDQFYTSIPRSRMDGLGDLHIANVGIRHRWRNLFFELEASASFGAGVGEPSFNKYNVDDYHQLNASIHYEFSQFLKGLNVDFLYVWKENKHEHGVDLSYQRSDFNQINFITNFNF